MKETEKGMHMACLEEVGNTKRILINNSEKLFGIYDHG
jgi:hypothetical protein